MGLQADVKRFARAGSLKRVKVRLVGKTGEAPGCCETCLRTGGAGT